jgi:hypothetical protein
MNKQIFILMALIFSIFPLTAQSEYAVMKAGDGYCKVEIRQGQYGSGNPEQLPVTYSGSASKGQQWSGVEGERICARRSGIPADCNSGLSNWFCISPYKDVNQGNPQEGTF